MPSKTERERRFMGADLARLRAGETTRTGMSESQLEEFARKPLTHARGGSIAVRRALPIASYAKGGTQLLSEPSAVVGLHSGRVYATIDENGKKDPEILKIINPGRKLPVPASMRGGVRTNAGGGNYAVSANDAYIQTGPGSAGYGASGQTSSSSSSGGRQLPDKSGVYNAQQAEITAQRNALAASQGEFNRIQGAKANTADIAATGQAQAIRNAEQEGNQAYGINPVEVNVQPGQENALKGPGVVANLKTQAENVTDLAKTNAESRAFGLQGAGLDVSQATLDYNRKLPTATPGRSSNSSSSFDENARNPREVAANNAAIIAARNGRTGGATGDSGPRGRQAPVSSGFIRADTNEWVPGQGPGSAGALATAQQAADQKLVPDPITGRLGYAKDIAASYGGPAGLAKAQAGQSIVTNPVTGEAQTRNELVGITDKKTGTIYQKSSGSWADPKSGNEFINGHWTDPTTGNFMVDRNTWQTPEGLLWHVIDPSKNSGWWTDLQGKPVQIPPKINAAPAYE